MVTFNFHSNPAGRTYCSHFSDKETETGEGYDLPKAYSTETWLRPLYGILVKNSILDVTYFSFFLSKLSLFIELYFFLYIGKLGKIFVQVL